MIGVHQVPLLVRRGVIAVAEVIHRLREVMLRERRDGRARATEGDGQQDERILVSVRDRIKVGPSLGTLALHPGHGPIEIVEQFDGSGQESKDPVVVVDHEEGRIDKAGEKGLSGDFLLEFLTH